jgi:hypothetical protein
VDVHKTVGVEDRPPENALRQLEIVRADPVHRHEDLLHIHPSALGIDVARTLAHSVHDLVELRVFEP